MKIFILGMMTMLLIFPNWGKAESTVNEPANATAAFLGSAEQWPQCRIVINDIQGLWGGTAIVVDGSGKCIIRIIKVAGEEKRYSVNLPVDESAALRKLLIDVDFSTIKIKERPGVPDEARPLIILQNSEGAEQAKTKWANDKVEGFDKVYLALLDLQKKTAGLKPEYEGKYDRDWQPTQQALKETEPVRVNGVDFQLVGAVTWITPAENKETIIPLALKVTSHAGKAVTLNLFDTISVSLKDTEGKEMLMGGGRDETRPWPPLRIEKDQSGTVDRTAKLQRMADKPEQFRLTGSDGAGGIWWFDGLMPGKYTLVMSYENSNAGPRGASYWIGKATTKELAIEIAVPVEIKK